MSGCALATSVPQAATLASRALREEFGSGGLPGQLALGAVGFGISAGIWSGHPAWSLALSLWLACLSSQVLMAALCRALSHRLEAWGWRLGLPLLSLAVLTGATFGWRLDLLLQASVPSLAPAVLEPLARAGLHLSFVGLLLGLPLIQTARRLAALQRVEGERDRVLAELQLLQAQIEPHFLFNTLATLRGLVRQQSDQALPLLDRMTGFLEAVLPQLRDAQSTLGRELHIVEQYLGIMAQRLGLRLRYRIEAAPELHALPLPPLLLQPLVENAITHGIEPCEEGGEVQVQATLCDGRLQLSVFNSGLGLQAVSAHAGQGVALRNLRQRLQALYGSAAEFRLESRGDGTEALLTFPIANS